MLTEEQNNNLTIFKEVSGIENDLLAIELLANHEWDINRAINDYSLQGEDMNDDIIESTPLIRQRSTSASNNTINNSINNSHNQNTANHQTTTAPRPPDRSDQNDGADRPPARSISGVMKWLFSAQRVMHNPDTDTTKFVGSMNLTYDNNLPDFFDRGYQSAVRQAFLSSKFLLVYLHSAMHDSAHSFCRDVLASNDVKQFINVNYVLWGGSVYDPEAFSLTYQLKCKGFPFLAVLMPRSEHTTELMDSLYGDISARQLLDRLQHGQQTYGSAIADVRQTLVRREDADRLRDEQDREYRESIERDRVMREASERERERRQLEERELQQRAAEIAQQEELERVLALSESLSREKELDEKRMRLSAEPADEGSSGTVSSVRFQLPKGGKVARRFFKTDTIQTIHDYLEVYLHDIKSEVKSFSVSTNYPKRELSCEKNLTIEEAGLHPRGMLFVQDLDA